jgi:PAS domain S-box-containing protein
MRLEGESMIDASDILVVDDDAENLALLTDMLAAEGYHVRAADSGRLALESAGALPPKLVLLDIHMPGMDGFEACRRLKATGGLRNVPVMFISAASEEEERVQGLSIGAVDYITKPFRREELLARVRTHLELARLRDQLEKQVLERTAELRHTVDQLSESEERFRLMADTAPVMIWISDTDKLCSFFNKIWLAFTGRSMQQEQGNGWAEGVHPDDLERCVGVYSSSFDARENFQIEYRLRRADGEFRWVLDNGTPRFAASGEFAGYIGSAIDITDLKRMQEEALSRKKLEALMSLTRGIAHDFNNLAGAILAQAELAEADMADGSTPTEEVHHIKAAAIRAAEVVRELMIYAGQEEAKLESVDLSRLVEEMTELLKASISKHTTLRLDLGRSLPDVRGNAAQIRQLVMNLIINASQAIGERNGLIKLKTSLAAHASGGSASDYVRLEVSDTGGGMTDEVKARIFDPFFTTKVRGHGLGLAVVQAIVHAHEGRLNVASTPGTGTSFEVLFRRAARDAGIPLPAIHHAAAPQGLPSVSGMILLVEDEDLLRLATASALRKRGFSVVTAADGRTAIEVFRERLDEIGVVLLDLSLPAVAGQEALRQMRAIKPQIKVMLTSAYDPKYAETVTSAEGPVRFLQKPYQFSDLLAALQESLAEPQKARSAP